MVATYSEGRPGPAVYDFLRHDVDTLDARCGGVVATTFRTVPSFPQRYIERAEVQPVCEADAAVLVEPLRANQLPTQYTERDLQLRQFCQKTSRRLPAFRAA